MAKDCNFSNPLMTEVADTCFTFTNLMDGANYCYWARAVDLVSRIVFSDTVMSIQDASLPQIAVFDLFDKKILGDRIWLNSRNVQLRLMAKDKEPGEIRNFQILENGEPDSLMSLIKPSGRIDTTISVVIKSEECLPIELSTKVIDGAGNESSLSSITIFLDETPPDPVSVLNCDPLLNSIKLDWTASEDPGNCSGLAGYRIHRNGHLLNTVAPNVKSYEDLFSEDVASRQFIYQNSTL